MSPHEMYDALERAWKDAAVTSMVLKEITEGRKKPNPDAWTFEQHLSRWETQAQMLRSVLDGLSDLKYGVPK